MPSLGDAAAKQKKTLQRAVGKTTGTYKVATTSPDFTVYLDGGSEEMPGLKVAGLTYAVDDVGVYLLRQGQKPLCIPTA